MALRLLDTTEGFGDNGKVGGDKINAMMRELYRVGGAAALVPGSKVTQIFDGDSKGSEAVASLAWAAARLRIDARPKQVAINIGTTGSGTGGTTFKNLTDPARITNIGASIDAEIAAGQVVDYLLKIGTNDLGSISTGANPPTFTLANIRKLHEQVLRPRGVRYLVLVSIDPRNDANHGALIASVNRMFQAYARANPADTIFVDETNWLIDLDPANVNGFPFPYTAPTSGSGYAGTQRDGLHKSTAGEFMANYAYDEYLRRAFSPRTLPTLSRADTYSARAYWASYGPRRTVALGGTLQAGVTDIIAVTGTPPAGFDFRNGGLFQANTTTGGSGASGLAVDFSVSPVPALDQLLGVPGARAVRMAFSGTLTQDVIARLYVADFNTMAIGDEQIITALMSFNNLVGLSGLQLGTSKHASGYGMGIPGAQTTAAAAVVPRIDGLYGFETPVATMTNTAQNGNVTLDFRFRATGQPVTGSVDLIAFGPHKVGPIPAAAA